MTAVLIVLLCLFFAVLYLAAVDTLRYGVATGQLPLWISTRLPWAVPVVVASLVVFAAWMTRG